MWTWENLLGSVADNVYVTAQNFCTMSFYETLDPRHTGVLYCMSAYVCDCLCGRLVTQPLPTTHIRKKVSSLATLPVYQRTVFSCTHVSTTEREKKCTDGNSTRCSDRVPKSSLLFRICKKYQTPIISKNEGKNKKINAFQYIVLPIVLTSFKYIYMYIWYIYEANILQRGI